MAGLTIADSEEENAKYGESLANAVVCDLEHSLKDGTVYLDRDHAGKASQ